MGDRGFLEGVFHKLLMNFTWWVNRKERIGKNVFEGGVLGLDNIGVFDRSAPLPTGGTWNRRTATGWMAMYCLDMLTIAVELALDNPVYEDLACKFFEHFIYIASAMDRIGINNDELWDEEDGFYYDVLRLPRGEAMRVKVRSMVGLIPLVRLGSLQLRHSGAAAPHQTASRALCPGERHPPDAYQQSPRAGCGRTHPVVAGESTEVDASLAQNARPHRVSEPVRCPGAVPLSQGAPLLFCGGRYCLPCGL